MPDVESLLRQMTLQEKVLMLAGSDFWRVAAIKRLGIPALKVTDGPAGARGGGNLTGGVKSTSFPAEIVLASTWNTELVERIGQALAQETKTKSAHVLLAPTVNIQRPPLGGRNFECFSEDPYLTSRMAVAYITGLQREGIGASVKHYLCNDAEFERTTISSEVRERALREIYLPPFHAAVCEAKTWTIMASYNLINGIAASEHPSLLTEILRDEWGFDGVVMSDWLASAKSTAASVNAGLDLEMPGPPIWRGEKLLQAVEHGEVEEATIERSVRRLLQLLVKVGAFEHPEEAPEQALDLPEHRALIRETGGEGMVLLKNEQNVLPLQRERLTSIAVIGPNAREARIGGGGSAQVNTHYAVTPFDGIVAKAGERIRVRYELGCTNHRLLPLLDMDQFLAGTQGTDHGLSVEYFHTPDLAGTPLGQEIKTTADIQWFDNPGRFPAGVNPQQFAVRITALFRPHVSGTYTFGLLSSGLTRLLIEGGGVHQKGTHHSTSPGLTRLFIDEQELIDNWTQQTRGDTFFGRGSSEVQKAVALEAGREYLLKVEFAKTSPHIMVAVRVGCLPPIPADALERAVALAASSDVAVVCVGTSGEWESEGSDKLDITLPGQQDVLVERVAAVNPRTIVVLNTGSPFAMPWLDKVAGVLEAWFPGQECGNAIADILFGDTNPSGKLPQTFPVRLEDHPAYLNFPGENGKVYYGEGLFVGYRYYEKKKIVPLFPFGLCLSYTTFSYSPLRLSAQDIGPDDTLQVSVDVTNTGERTGKEVVQLYVRDEQALLQRPEKELKGFAKVQLEPGERKTVMLSIARDGLAYYDDLARAWVAQAGEFEVLVGASSQDIRARATFTLTATTRWPS